MNGMFCGFYWMVLNKLCQRFLFKVENLSWQQMNNNVNKVLMMSNFQKEEYVSPEFKTSLVEVEQGIAASSAIVLPPDSGGVIQENWDDDSNDDRGVEW